MASRKRRHAFERPRGSSLRRALGGVVLLALASSARHPARERVRTELLNARTWSPSPQEGSSCDNPWSSPWTTTTTTSRGRRRRRRRQQSVDAVHRVARGGETADDGGYYARLGVRPGASGDEIKRAYRKKSLSCHPDKGGDEESFKRLGEAYSVLSDPQKRRLYDRFGVAGVDPAAAASQQQQRYQQHGGSTGDARAAQAMFEQMFGSFGGAFGDAFGGASSNPFAAFGGGFGGQQSARRQPRRFAITVSLDDCYVGRAISVSLGDETCQVRVEPGAGEGDVIRAVLGGAPVYFELREAPHAVFKRSGADLLVDASIPLADALGGAPRVAIKRLDGSTLRVNLAPLGTVLRHGAVRSLDGEGMPVKGAAGARRGRLFVRVFVVFPKTIDLEPRDRARLRALLGAPPRKDGADFDSRLRTLREADPHDWGRPAPSSSQGGFSSSSRGRPQTTPRGAAFSGGGGSSRPQQQRSRPPPPPPPGEDEDDDDDDDDGMGGFSHFFR